MKNLNYFRCAKFLYVEHDNTHVKVQDRDTEKYYNIPLVLIEFVNPGVMRLTRVVEILEGSFVNRGVGYFARNGAMPSL